MNFDLRFHLYLKLLHQNYHQCQDYLSQHAETMTLFCTSIFVLVVAFLKSLDLLLLSRGKECLDRICDWRFGSLNLKLRYL
jgi:hypothetical protein